MATIQIPISATQGFKVIEELSPEKIKKISDYLERMPIDTKMSSFQDFISSLMSVHDSKAFMNTLMSFSELIMPPNVDLEILVENLSNSYNEVSNSNLIPSKLERLRSNLYDIFVHAKNLKLTFKASDLLLEEESLFRNCKIITDIRIVFKR